MKKNVFAALLFFLVLNGGNLSAQSFMGKVKSGHPRLNLFPGQIDSILPWQNQDELLQDLLEVVRFYANSALRAPHISGTGLGYIYMTQFVSAIPNAGPFHEFKGVSTDIPFECKTSTLAPENGILHLPKGIGSGVEIDPGFIAKHKLLKI